MNMSNENDISSNEPEAIVKKGKVVSSKPNSFLLIVLAAVNAILSILEAFVSDFVGDDLCYYSSAWSVSE